MEFQQRRVVLYEVWVAILLRQLLVVNYTVEVKADFLLFWSELHFHHLKSAPKKKVLLKENEKGVAEGAEKGRADKSAAVAASVAPGPPSNIPHLHLSSPTAPPPFSTISIS